MYAVVLFSVWICSFPKNQVYEHAARQASQNCWQKEELTEQFHFVCVCVGGGGGGGGVLLPFWHLDPGLIFIC